MSTIRRWFGDFEFYWPVDEPLPVPLCFVGYCPETAEWVRLNRGEFPDKPPFCNTADSVFVSYALDAELSCFEALRWNFPPKAVDLHAEYLNYANFLERAVKFTEHSLLHALTHFRINHITSAEKDRMRKIAIEGGPRTQQEAADLIRYCASDVEPLVPLYDKLVSPDNFPQAVERARYLKAVTLMQLTGAPIDVPKHQEFRWKWETIRWDLVDAVDRDFGVFNGLSFNYAKFSAYLERNKMDWPVSPLRGLPKLDKKTRKAMVSRYPQLAPLHELISTLSVMKKESIAVGKDGRNHTSLFPFGSRTGRNQPSSAKFIFGAPSWMRSFSKAEPGDVLAAIDFEQEEIGIAGALSMDKAMQSAYQSGDFYLMFAKMAKAIPADATKKSHPAERELFKACALGVQYSMQAQGLSLRIGKTVAEAQELLDQHHKQFPDFWHWIDRILTHVEFNRSLRTRSGWRIVRVNRYFSAKDRRSAQNWMIQSTGSDILRLSACLLTEAGIRVCSPIHDAFLLQDSAERIRQTVAKAQELMQQASRSVLGGFELRTEATIFDDQYIDDLRRQGFDLGADDSLFRGRYIDKRGIDMWVRINGLMDACKRVPGEQGLLFGQEHFHAVQEQG